MPRITMLECAIAGRTVLRYVRGMYAPGRKAAIYIMQLLLVDILRMTLAKRLISL